MYNEEVQEEALELMTKNGLELGRFLEIKQHVLANVVVGTEEDGDFWYGDLDLNRDSGKLKNVASILGKSLLLRNVTSILGKNLRVLPGDDDVVISAN
jgi:hypothetical protein